MSPSPTGQSQSVLMGPHVWILSRIHWHLIFQICTFAVQYLSKKCLWYFQQEEKWYWLNGFFLLLMDISSLSLLEIKVDIKNALWNSPGVGFITAMYIFINSFWSICTILDARRIIENMLFTKQWNINNTMENLLQNKLSWELGCWPKGMRGGFGLVALLK